MYFGHTSLVIKLLGCLQEFANKSDMQRHAKEAHRMEEKGHKCGQCLKTFPSSQQLTQHSLVHTNLRKYACAYCDKAFKQLSHVQQHQRIHTGLHQTVNVTVMIGGDTVRA